MNRYLLALGAASLMAGCGTTSGGDAGAVDAGVTDAGVRDAGSDDAGSADAGALDAGSDAGSLDAGRLDAGGADSGADAGADAGPGDGGLQLVAGQWLWFEQPGSRCDDGSATGIGVNAGTSGGLVVFFVGGGLCWDRTTCEVLNTSVHGPFGAAQLAQASTALSSSPLFDRSSGANPYRDDTYVFFPACTGDLGLGQVERRYTDGGTRVLHHWGRGNVLAALPALAATFRAPTRVTVIGSSTGGAAGLFNYGLLRAQWPAVPMALVSDSFPLLVGDALAPTQRRAWVDAWAALPALAESCDGGCVDDLSALYGALARRYPADRFALLSSTQDAVQRSLSGLGASAYEAQVLGLRASVLEPSGWRSFLVGGTQHVLLASGGAALDAGVLGWLGDQLRADAGWQSVGP